MTDSDRADALLTSTQREFLRNQGDYYTGEFAKQQRYDRRESIKKRVWNGFLDGTTLLKHTTPDQRRAMFNGWEDFAQPESVPGDDDYLAPADKVAESRGEWLAKLQASNGFQSWIAFLYLGLSETGRSFETILRRGIEQAEESRGRIVTDLDFGVETRDRRSLDELKERFERHTRLTTEEIQRLRAADEITDEQLVAYYDDLGAIPALEHEE